MQTFCKFSNIEVGIDACNNPSVSPNGQLPSLLLIERSTVHAYGRDAYRRLAAQFNDIDNVLSSQQRCEALAIQSLLSDRFYWALVWFFFFVCLKFCDTKSTSLYIFLDV
jgi:hypothetical protein